MSVRSIAIIGKNTTSSSTRTNEEPVLYIREFTTTTTTTTVSTERNNDNILTAQDDDNNNHITNDDNDELELFGLQHLRSNLPPATTEGTLKGRSSSLSLLFSGCSIRQQFILHAALDRFDELNGPPPGCLWRHTTASSILSSHLSTIPESAMFVGLLYPIEDMRVYGYQTTTQIRFLVTIEDDWNHHNSLIGTSIYNSNTTGNNSIDQQQRILEETSILRLFIQLHRIYVEYILNPFSNINGPIKSKQFDTKIAHCIQTYNNNNNNTTSTTTNRNAYQ